VKPLLLKAAVLVAVVYLLLLALMHLAQDRLLFIPTHALYRTPAANGWEFDNVAVAVGEETTTGWLVYHEPPSDRTILFSHGNAGNMADRLESIGLLRRLGYNVLVYDYGGYGASTGRPSEDRCYRDIRAMWRYLTDSRGFDASKIVLFGRSLGAGPTCQLATEVDAGAVIVESAFLSVPAMAQRLYPIFPAKWLARHTFDNASKVASIDEPLLVVHSPEDSIIPYDHGQKLFELAKEPKTFLTIHGDHNDGFWQTGEPYLAGMRSFLDRAVTKVSHAPSE